MQIEYIMSVGHKRHGSKFAVQKAFSLEEVKSTIDEWINDAYSHGIANFLDTSIIITMEQAK